MLGVEVFRDKQGLGQKQREEGKEESEKDAEEEAAVENEEMDLGNGDKNGSSEPKTDSDNPGTASWECGGQCRERRTDWRHIRGVSVTTSTLSVKWWWRASTGFCRRLPLEFFFSLLHEQRILVQWLFLILYSCILWFNKCTPLTKQHQYAISFRTVWMNCLHISQTCNRAEIWSWLKVLKVTCHLSTCLKLILRDWRTKGLSDNDRPHKTFRSCIPNFYIFTGHL